MTALRVIFIEDNDDDYFLTVGELARNGFEVAGVRVQDEAGLRSALDDGPWDIVVADYRLPRFNAPAALRIVRSCGCDVPFVVVSATIGDELAVELMRQGASDYVMKSNLVRLGPVVAREIRELAFRRERLQVAEALRVVQLRCESTFQHAPIGIAHTTEDGRFRLINDRFCEILGYSREELLQTTLPEITHPADRDFSKEELRTLTGARDFLQMEKRCIRKDGETIWIVLTITPVRSTDGAVDYCIAMADDVTERRTAGERIRFQARLLDAVEQAVIATDVEGRITYWNNYAEKVYGWRADEVMGRNIVDITCPSMSADEAAAVMQKLSAAESWSGEFIVRDRSGRNFPCMVIDSPILDAGGTLTGVVGVS
ncbi:MAG TPA: PAS domain S-box protein, partial [Thermoanaerobaculia bacterium]